MSLTLARDTKPEDWDPRHYLKDSEIVEAIHTSFATSCTEWISRGQQSEAKAESEITDWADKRENWYRVGQEVKHRLDTQYRWAGQDQTTIDQLDGTSPSVDYVIIFICSDANSSAKTLFPAHLKLCHAVLEGHQDSQ